jgi:predicted transcriptional regulator
MQIRMAVGVRKRLAREANRRMVSNNFLIERAVEESLDRWEQEAAVSQTPVPVS